MAGDDDQAAGPGPAAAAGRPAWAEDLKTEILDAVKNMVGGARDREREHLTEPGQSRSDRAERQGEDLERQIDAAVTKVTEAKERERQQAGDRDRLDKLEAAAAERPPIERGPLHKLMAWGDPAR